MAGLNTGRGYKDQLCEWAGETQETGNRKTGEQVDMETGRKSRDIWWADGV